ncbi:hypothetical protein FPCIR_14105 [Fusarium pseudocircinatum]|uniref:Uncharacterized protein n=1 Tax=Fusarium pseudocircinatum TaxID=56676 RepID=A0A8H5NR40_9HYPO|nr:hypothetical protein FPCIR_14105 [Fusarium pseudocircinatum]
MANNNGNGKQVQDDKGISGPLLHVLPPNAFQHPPTDERVNHIPDGMVEEYIEQYMNRYIGQLGRNQLVVSHLAGLPAVLFRVDDASSIVQALEIADSIKNEGQLFNCKVNRGDSGFSGLVWLTNNTVEDKDDKTKSKALDDMTKE